MNFSSADLKNAFSVYIKENHPDIVSSQTEDEEEIELANRKLQVANLFYSILKKGVGF